MSDARVDARSDARLSDVSRLDQCCEHTDATTLVDVADDVQIARDAAAPVDVDLGPHLLYPERTGVRVKGVYPDFWPNPEQIAASGAGIVALEFSWNAWEQTRSAPPCGTGMVPYDGHCFRLDPLVHSTVLEYSRRDVAVTAVITGVPTWARTTTTCPLATGNCMPDSPADLARYAGFLSQMYDGRHGNGRVANFVLFEGANNAALFNVGCTSDAPCVLADWISRYAAIFRETYDRVTAEQRAARVYISLDNAYEPTLDALAGDPPIVSIKTFLPMLLPMLGTRDFRVGIAPFNANRSDPTVVSDLGDRVTMGTIGNFVGWLGVTFPGNAVKDDVMILRAGFPSSQGVQPQATALCNAFRNVAGTPGITSFLTYRMLDNGADNGLFFGLWAAIGAARPAWNTWNTLTDATGTCGFSELPYVRLTRYQHPTLGSRVTTRTVPDGFAAMQSWRVLREPAGATHVLRECLVGSHSLLSGSPTCEGLTPLGPIGYVYDDPAPGRVTLVRCLNRVAFDHFVSTDGACEGHTSETILGYALPPP